LADGECAELVRLVRDAIDGDKYFPLAACQAAQKHPGEARSGIDAETGRHAVPAAEAQVRAKCNVHSADGWRAVLEPMIARYRGSVKRLNFRGDAAFANPEIYEFLEAEGICYTIRLPANRVLQDRIGYLLKRPVGRPSHEVRRYFASFGCRAQNWNRSRHVVAKVEWHPGCTRASGSS
jgi:hypothetical protein